MRDPPAAAPRGGFQPGGGGQYGAPVRSAASVGGNTAAGARRCRAGGGAGLHRRPDLLRQQLEVEALLAHPQIEVHDGQQRRLERRADGEPDDPRDRAEHEHERVVALADEDPDEEDGLHDGRDDRRQDEADDQHAERAPPASLDEAEGAAQRLAAAQALDEQRRASRTPRRRRARCPAG